MSPGNQHVMRARANAAAAELHSSVVSALVQVLQEDLKGRGYYSRQPPQQGDGRSAPSDSAVWAFLEPRLGSWPPNMRQYLFANLRQIFTFVQQQQQQQQMQQQQMQQQQQQQQEQPEEEPFSAVVLRMLRPQLEPAQQEANRTERVLSALEDVAPPPSPPRAAVTAPAKEPPKEAVEFEIHGPAQASKATPFTLDVWAFLNSQREKVGQLAKRGGQAKTASASAQVERGSVLALQLYATNVDIDQPVRALSWNGQETWESFTCNLKPNASAYAWIDGKAAMSLNGLLIASISFTIPVAEKAGAGATSLRQTTMRPQTAFASYSSSDRIDVERSAQGIEKGAPYLSVWMDVDSLRSGENWEEKLYAVISTSDIFYLFWSQAAAKSPWVDREWRYALREKGISFIDPFPLESPQLAPPPSELATLHFNDRRLASILAEKYIQAELKVKTVAGNQQGNPSGAI